ncbi:RE1 [Symbiodinium sp. CCMP2592]|nr:RE1 [Symbiodinium sp. CCMP2592]
MTCSNCISGREFVEESGKKSREGTEEEQSMYTQQEHEQVEELANKLYQNKQYQTHEAESLLEHVSRMNHGAQRRMASSTTSGYATFGMYSHGNHYGMTRKTDELPHTTRYFNAFLKHRLPKGSHWTSFVLSCNAKLPIHRDIHNDSQYPNHLMGMGTYTGGELWLEAPPGYEGQDKLLQESIDGRTIVGRKIPTKGQHVEFSPQAHWKLGICEQAVQGVKEVMGKLCDDDPNLSMEEVLALAVMTFNQRAPIQQLWEDPQGDFERAAQLRAKAVGQQGRRQPGDKHGRFVGPARILATERKRESDGSLVPGGSVWLVRGRSLIKCCPEQIRRASEREQLVETLVSPEQRTPWSFTRVASEIGGNQYQDVSSDKPTNREWLRAQDPGEEQQPSRHRIRGKRPAPEGVDMGEEEDEDTVTPATSSRSPRAQRQKGSGFQAAQAWWTEVPERLWEPTSSAYWASDTAAVAVEVDLPHNTRGLEKTLHNLPAFFVGAMKRRAVEVCERKLTEEDKEKFRAAKTIEVRNFIAAKAFETLPEEMKPSRDQAINMRWILTWKATDDGGRKAKARAVLLGYQDPKYEHRATTAPVMTRQTRQMQLQLTTIHGWTVQKGDVSGAFLQGREYPDQLFCVPCKEICEAMGIPENTITRLKRACYGLVDAPLEWYRTVDAYLQELGLERTYSDACAWVWRPQGRLRGMISGHVDDFLFSGGSQDKEWQDILEKIKQRFQWGDWDTDKFVQCGVQVERTSEGFLLSQPRYLEGIQEIPISSSRRKEKDTATTERERTQLRALLGGLSWHAQQVAPHLSAEVSLLLSEVPESTVETIVKANLLAYHAKGRKDHQMIIHQFSPEEPLALFGWVDAASQNRRDGGSTQGIFIGLGPASMLTGDLGKVTPVAWHSNRIDRACRSPGAAEAQAAINGEDALYFARYQWSELVHGRPEVRDPDATVAKVTGCLVTDSRNVYDKLETEVLVIKGAEKRTNIELLSLKEAQRHHGLLMRWVHSEAQLANALTKHNSKEMELYYRTRHMWRIVEDPERMSARRRKQAGIEPLSSGMEKSG